MADIGGLVNQALGTLSQSNTMLSEVQKSLTAGTQALRDNTSLNIAEATQLAQDAGKVAEGKAQADYAQRSALEANQRIMGIDPDIAENEIVKSMAIYDQASRKQQELAGKNLLNDPMGYIMAQIQLPQIEATMNAASQNLATRLDLQAKIKNTVIANNAQILKDAALLDAKNVERQAMITARQQEMENTSRIAGSLMQQANLNNMQTDNAVKGTTLQIQQATLEMNREQLNMARDQQREINAERLKKMQADAAGQEQLNMGLQRVSQFLGLAQPLTMESVKLLPPKAKEAVINAAVTNNLGASLFDAMKSFNELPGGGNMQISNPQTALFIEKTGTTAQKYITALNKPNSAGQLPDKKKLPELAFDEYQHELQNSANNPTYSKPLSAADWNTTFNPYRANHKVMLASAPALGIPESNAMLQAVKTADGAVSANADNFTVNDEQRALKIVRDRVAKREMTAQQAAAEISQYYQMAAAKNADSMQYDLFGLPRQRKYMYTLERASVLGDPIQTDLMNPADIERALVKDVRGMAAVTGPAIKLGQERAAMQDKAFKAVTSIFNTAE